MGIRIDGHVTTGFEPVADAFRANFEQRGELGAAVAVYRGDELVVDLWAGTADAEHGTPWRQDTLGVTFSATKGLVAIAFLILEDRGLVDLDAPVASYWPAFGTDDVKAGITVRTLLNHRSGLSAIDTPLTLEDTQDDAVVEAALTAQQPLWFPGTSQGYGATAWGLYTQALFRHLTGERVGAWLRREVFEPLHAEVYLGLPTALDARVATLYPIGASTLVRHVLPEAASGSTLEGRVFRRLLFDKASATHRAFTQPGMGKARLNRLNEPAVRAMELPYMNGIATARGLGKVYSALLSGTRVGRKPLVRKAAIERIAVRQSWSYCDEVLRKPLGFSQGFVKDEAHLFSPHEASFCHPGAGGAIGLADPVEGLSIAYVMNRMDRHVRSPRALALCHAMYESVRGWR